ncbi:MAG: sodium/proton-translocating pyrophosphatase, partial [Candidatus Izimaplasma sp.]|nr:sodium/proton-translocating pyrophosphatase [Candidatus Izimaplasma bacterium]
MNIVLFLSLGIIISLSALIYAFYLYRTVLNFDEGEARVKEISSYIKEGAHAFLRSEYKVIFSYIIIATIIIFVGFYYGYDHISGLTVNSNTNIIVPQTEYSALFYGLGTALAFVLGSLFSLSAGYVGMKSATNANSRTTTAAEQSGIIKALDVAFKGGSVMGMSVVGFGLLGLFIVLALAFAFGLDPYEAITYAAGYSLGASSIALFGRVGGGIYTKAADVAADLVGKIEAEIPEDDPRNPAVIADNVGDNVGDVAGMGSDLLESYVSSVIGAATIAALIFTAAERMNGILFVTTVAFSGVLASMIGSFFVRGKEGVSPFKALKMGTYVSAGLFILFTFIANFMFLDTINSALYTDPRGTFMNILDFKFGFAPFFSIIIGLSVGVLIGLVSEYYTSSDYRHVKNIAKQSETGHATNIIAGISTGMESSLIPVLILATGIVSSYLIG